MYKTKQNYLSFKNHEIFTDKFKQYPKEQQATYWYNIWYILNIMEGCLSVIDFEHHNAGKKLVNKWLELWPFKRKPLFAQRVPTLIEGVDYLGSKYKFNHTHPISNKDKIDYFDYQVVYGVVVDLFKDELNISKEDVDAFLNPLKEYKLRKFTVVRMDTIKAVVGMSNFFMNTKDVWEETKNFGDWREMDSKRAIEEWKQGIQDHSVREDYPLDKSKIIDHRNGVDDNRWKRESFLDVEKENGVREEV
tara:strand:+ start:115 stop:858 length:744 start_codon:yes stop_codon:yes gene_type:complete